MRIIESPYLTEQFRFPRSKKKRIRAKWTKRPENHRPNITSGMLMPNGDLVCHPELAAMIRAENRSMTNEEKRASDAFFLSQFN